MQDAALFLLMYVIFPLWVAAGLADWACHARTGIATTSGLVENALHWLMYVEIGVGVVAVAYFEINAALLAIVLAVFVVHQATVYGELHYSTLRRDVGPFEQMVHSFMEVLPLVALLLLALAAWPAGFGDWTLRPKREPWPIEYLAAAAAASILFNAVPLMQETLACWRGRKRPKAAYSPRIEPKL